MPERIAVLGSTGSIGSQTLDIVSRYPDEFTVEILTAGNNVELLTKQAKQFHPDIVVIGNRDHYPQLKENLRDTHIKVYAGEEAIEQVISSLTVDVVVAAIVGYSGLRPTVAAIKAGKNCSAGFYWVNRLSDTRYCFKIPG